MRGGACLGGPAPIAVGVHLQDDGVVCWKRQRGAKGERYSSDKTGKWCGEDRSNYGNVYRCGPYEFKSRSKDHESK